MQRKAVSWLALAVLAACSCPTGAFRVCPGLAQFHTSVGVSAAPKLLKTPRAALVGTTKRCKYGKLRSGGSCDCLYMSPQLIFHRLSQNHPNQAVALMAGSPFARCAAVGCELQWASVIGARCVHVCGCGCGCVGVSVCLFFVSCGVVMCQWSCTGRLFFSGMYDHFLTCLQTCDKESGEAPLGCMPFPLDDLLLPVSLVYCKHAHLNDVAE